MLYVDYVRMLRRVPDWQRALPAEVVAAVGARVDIERWYPMSQFEQLGLTILDHVVQGDVDAIRRWGRASVQSVLPHFPGLVAEGEPRESLMRFQNFFLALFDYPSVRVEDLNDEEGLFIIEWGMSPRAEEAATWQAIGFFEGLVTAAGGHGVETKLFERSWLSGGPHTAFALSWSLPLGAAARPPRVLVVDDEAMVARAVSRMLGAAADVTVALGADDAVALLDARAFDVVVSDYAMPGRDGLSLLGEVAERWPHVRRVLHSGVVSGDEVVWASKSRLVHQVIAKPAARETLLQAVSAGAAAAR